MTEEIQVTIEAIDDKSPHLQTVIELGDANKATLSFFPEGAFRTHAARRQIIVAFAPQAGCIGYLLYGASPRYNRITIIHLCLASSHQGKGVARKLVDYLIQITQQYSGIGLTCRRDYRLDNFWSKLGFVAQYDEQAKTPGKLNTYWWLDHGHPNLFSTAAIHQRESKLCVIINADIFFDLYTNETSAFKESKSILADWLQPELDLCLTDEIFNKINHINNAQARKIQQKVAKNFTFLPCQNQRKDEAYQSLQTDFYQKGISVDDSDLRYLARTIASDVYILVTRDSQLLDIADDIYARFRLSIIRPIDLIVQLDELRTNPEYQPIRLAGTSLEQKRVQNDQETILNDYFQSDKQGETKADFQQKLRRFFAESHKFDCSVVFEGEKQPLALEVYDRHKRYELEIPMLRVGENPLAATIAHHLIFQAASLSAREQRQFTRITDPHLQEAVTTAIQKDTFVKVNNGWLRANIAVAETASQLAKRLSDLAAKLGQEYDFCRQIANSLNTANLLLDIKTLLDIEHFLFPAKIIDADIPTFIIPIQPFWAQQLFDAKLANQTLFGATKTELALNREAVYYKSKNAPKELKPGVGGRILWYVSNDDDRGYTGISSIRACSRFDEVVIGKPKELYRRFRNLGVYEWKSVLDVAHNKLDNDIMAIRFTDTEPFSNPIPLKRLPEVLGKKVTVQGTFYISKEDFAKLYTLGTYT
jgi:GNAT superfamily N-acetyltransferase/predicted nucleic acid-binding protein